MKHRQTRVQKVIALLRAHKNRRVPLPEIQHAGGAQFGARLKEIRALVYIVANEMERTPDGEIHSWYILRAEPGESVSLFPDITLEPEYPG
jgi:hypothetical protein